MQVLGETSFKHFCQNERDFEHRDDHIDFPIRDPLATSISWRCHQSNRTDMDEFRRWEAAIGYLGKHKHTIHKIEDHPVLEGQSGNGFWWKQALIDHDINALKKLPEVVYLLEWIKKPEIEEFFKPYYGDFWWLKKQETPSS